MIDIRLIRESPDLVKENIKKKFQEQKLVLVDKAVKIDADWRKLKYQEDALRSKRNSISEEINKSKKSKNEKLAKELIVKAKSLPEEIKKAEEKREEKRAELDRVLAQIPNIISERVPIGKDESENRVDKTIGKPEKKNFEVLGHVEIMEKLGIGDFDSSARVSGKGFYYLEGELALLNQALIRYVIDMMVSKGFRYIETPLMLNGGIIKSVTDIHDQENMIYKIENENSYLIGTSEHSLIGRFAGQDIESSKLPIKHTSYSMCFRREIGSHGVDERGLFRTHQFNKVEMIVICKPEESDRFFEELQKITIEIFKGLELPVRVLRICSGDLGDLKKEQVDIEVYSPRKKDYFEAGSCSNLTDAQARKLNISTRIKGVRVVPHTLNNTAIATSRALVAILENHQQKNGSIKIPKALWKYTKFKEIKAKK